MAIVERERARRKLGLRIAEAVELWLEVNDGQLDVDEVGRVIAGMIPPTRDEALADAEAVDKYQEEAAEAA